MLCRLQEVAAVLISVINTVTGMLTGNLLNISCSNCMRNINLLLCRKRRQRRWVFIMRCWTIPHPTLTPPLSLRERGHYNYLFLILRMDAICLVFACPPERAVVATVSPVIVTLTARMFGRSAAVSVAGAGSLPLSRM